MKNYILFISFFCFPICIASQTWSNLFTHNKEIKQISVATTTTETEVAVADSEGLFIYDNFSGVSKRFRNYTYTFENQSFTADFTKITHLEYLDRELLISTNESGTEGNFLMFEAGDFVAGIPVYVKYLREDYFDKYYTIFELPNSNENWAAEFDLIEKEFDPFGSPVSNDVAAYNLSDMTEPDANTILVMLDASQNKIVSSFDFSVKTFDMSRLPFNTMKQIEWIDQIPYDDGQRYDHLWVSTDKGFGVYISDSGRNIQNWNHVDWYFYNKENSDLRSNNIDYFERVELGRGSTGQPRKNLVGFSNDTGPVFYWIDGVFGDVCSYTSSNSILSSSKSINDIDQDGSGKVYIAQGTSIIKLDLLQLSCETSSADELRKTNFSVFPNPTDNLLVFSHSLTNYRIFNLLGQQVVNSYSEAKSIDVSLLSPGTYFIKGTRLDESTIKITFTIQ